VIEADMIRRMMNGIIWHNHQQHFDAIYIMASMAHAFAERGYTPVVLVDTLGFGSLEMALRELGSESVSVYSLVCRPRSLAWRLVRRVRGYRDVRKARRFNDHILAEAAGRADLIDTTRASAKHVCRRILELEFGAAANALPTQNSVR
jgi:hypothetical protein